MNAPKDKQSSYSQLQRVIGCLFIKTRAFGICSVNVLIRTIIHNSSFIYSISHTLGFHYINIQRPRLMSHPQSYTQLHCAVKLLTAPWVVSLGIGHGQWQEKWPDIHVFDGGEKPEHPDKTHGKTRGERFIYTQKLSQNSLSEVKVLITEPPCCHD